MTSCTIKEDTYLVIFYESKCLYLFYNIKSFKNSLPKSSSSKYYLTDAQPPYSTRGTSAIA